MPVEDLVQEVRLARRDVDRRVGEARAVGLRGQEVQASIASLRSLAESYERLALLFNSIGEARQSSAQRTIEGLVTQGLQTIFGEDLSFHLVASEQRKTATVDFVVRTQLADGTVLDTPVMESRGGGLAATVGFLVRLVVLLLSRQRQETVLFLDETFAHVSAEYLDRLSEFLREVVDKTGVQLVLVTHQPALAENADKVYRFSLDDAGVTRVEARV